MHALESVLPAPQSADDLLAMVGGATNGARGDPRKDGIIGLGSVVETPEGPHMLRLRDPSPVGAQAFESQREHCRAVAVGQAQDDVIRSFRDLLGTLEAIPVSSC
jgi:hypothetical protein